MSIKTLFFAFNVYKCYVLICQFHRPPVKFRYLISLDKNGSNGSIMYILHLLDTSQILGKTDKLQKPLF